MSFPFFSVILPTYNRSRMACTALKTVQYQTCADWECLVVNDGSTDDTDAVLAGFSNDPRIRILRSEKNQGMNASRNQAIGQAQGRFVTFLDSDDLWLPQRLEAFRARITGSVQAGFLFSNAYVWRFGRILGTLFDPARPIPEGVVPGHYAVGEAHLPYVTTNVAIRRDAFSQWGSFKTEMRTLDTELFTRFLANGLPVCALREPLSVRRLHDGQLTDRHVENFRESLLALEASGASAELQASMRKDICREVALYLLKAGEPLKAREFLLSELGESARATPLFMGTLLPKPVLRLGKELRRTWLMLRHHPLLASSEIRKISALIDPLLSAEQ
ncbi:MAG: glycosyltransferase family 2 protein [Elusimicrobiota bacterium]|jgi:glycosyltransferase involved in cell wall biosynthesis